MMDSCPLNYGLRRFPYLTEKAERGGPTKAMLRVLLTSYSPQAHCYFTDSRDLRRGADVANRLVSHTNAKEHPSVKP